MLIYINSKICKLECIIIIISGAAFVVYWSTPVVR